MSLFSEMQAAATEAQSTLAELQGMASGGKNFVGPDGAQYVMVFRPADAFESQSVSREMLAHGYNDRSVIVGTATRTQFGAAPLDWRRKKGTRLKPDARECVIASVSDDDPLVYVFVLLVRQPA